MKINMEELIKTKTLNKKRRGRGYGSGKGGHTTGRGQKGQKSRTSISILFEGVKVKKSLIKRLPFQRGKSKHKPGKNPIVIKLGALDLLPSGSIVNIDTLIKNGIVERNQAYAFGVKILGSDDIKKKFTIQVPISKGAAKKIEKSGGKIIIQGQDKKTNKNPKEAKGKK